MNPTLTAHLQDPIPVADLGAPGDLGVRVEAKARRLHELTQRAFPDWSPPPFDPLVMAEALGIQVGYARTPPGCHAMLIPQGCEGFRIVCRQDTRSEGRIRFSVAHELVHTFFDDAAEVVRMRMEARRKVRPAEPPDPVHEALERLCNAGAAELVMPREFFARDLRRLGSGAQAIPELAETFQVSAPAAGLRMLECAGPGLRAVGFFEYARRPSERAGRGEPCAAAGRRRAPGPDAASAGAGTYRVNRVFSRPGVPFLFPAGKSVPESSVIYRCSLGRRELHDVEEFALGRERGRFEVSAWPLHRSAEIDEPPVVCAVFLAT